MGTGGILIGSVMLSASFVDLGLAVGELLLLPVLSVEGGRGGGHAGGKATGATTVTGTGTT